ncbi:MAG: Smr/MutS family protein [Alphaproteobacteria bacterium]|nr:Smr/MutS family protein [Alphaproteobacteria bacterium]
MKKGRDSGNKGENGRALWVSVTRNVKAYRPEKAAAAPSEQRIRKMEPARPAPPEQPPVRTPRAADSPPRGFDRSTETKLKRGRLPLEGRIDLHGMTQAEAFAALDSFVRTAAAQKKRTVLVITGKGHRFEGVLRRKLPEWLAEPELACHVVAVTPAQPKDGGAGAFYLRLKKPK